ncbi:MAG: hypothetical protein OSJ83_05035 [Clostridia bacterium]|nr:hypothetical protein [Clostridia bacterium]
MANSDKFVTMIGFGKRAGKLVYGIDKLKTARGVKLIAVSDTASDNLRTETERLADRLKVCVVIAKEMETLVGNNVKALGFTDENMARAVVEYIDGGDAEDIYQIRKGLRR